MMDDLVEHAGRIVRRSELNDQVPYRIHPDELVTCYLLHSVRNNKASVSGNELFQQIPRLAAVKTEEGAPLFSLRTTRADILETIHSLRDLEYVMIPGQAVVTQEGVEYLERHAQKLSDLYPQAFGSLIQALGIPSKEHLLG